MFFSKRAFNVLSSSSRCSDYNSFTREHPLQFSVIQLLKTIILNFSQSILSICLIKKQGAKAPLQGELPNAGLKIRREGRKVLSALTSHPSVRHSIKDFARPPPLAGEAYSITGSVNRPPSCSSMYTGIS
jgi:hypothetical protein